MGDWIDCKYCGGSLRIIFGDSETTAHEACEEAFKNKNFKYIEDKKNIINSIKFFKEP